MGRKWAKIVEWEAGQQKNQTHEALHNHNSHPHIVYAGYSATAPYYHLFKCIQLSDQPRRTRSLIPFDQEGFSEDAKAGRGGCSMRLCHGDAVMMNAKGSQAYCTVHAAKVSPKRTPCAWTSIVMCPRKLRLGEGLYTVPCLACGE